MVGVLACNVNGGVSRNENCGVLEFAGAAVVKNGNCSWVLESVFEGDRMEKGCVAVGETVGWTNPNLEAPPSANGLAK